jgi:hypothetical protein
MHGWTMSGSSPRSCPRSLLAPDGPPDDPVALEVALTRPMVLIANRPAVLIEGGLRPVAVTPARSVY